MNQISKYSKLVALGTILLLSVSPALAGQVNITMGDPNYTGEGGMGWAKGGNGVLSDYQEVEPGMITGVEWDLAAFTADTTAKTLGIVSGYDLRDGYSGTTLGDIFVSANPPTPVTYPDGQYYPKFVKNGSVLPGTVPAAAMNWDYAIRLNWTSATGGNYVVYALTANTYLENGEYAAQNPVYNAASMPWKVASTNTATNGNGHGVLTYTNGDNASLATVFTSTFSYSDSAGATAESKLLAGLGSGANLNAYTLASSTSYTNYLQLNNMDWLAGYQVENTPDYFHLTMWCGNDDLWGSTSTGYQKAPDGSLTILLLGIGITALAAFSRRRIS